MNKQNSKGNNKKYTYVCIDTDQGLSCTRVDVEPKSYYQKVTFVKVK